MNVYDLAHGLARNLRQHPEITALHAAKAKVDADPQAKSMLENLVQKSMELQMREMGGTPVSDEEKEQLQKLSEIVFLHADVRAYHEQSLRAERLLQDIYGIIANAVQVEDE